MILFATHVISVPLWKKKGWNCNNISREYSYNIVYSTIRMSDCWNCVFDLGIGLRTSSNLDVAPSCHGGATTTWHDEQFHI
jgi:hypothetical protein